MQTKTEKRQAALARTLVETAERQIVAAGLHSVRARDIARQAGCAVGAIYNVYDDLNALVMAVNGRTFQKIGVAVSASLEGAQGLDPNARLILMSKAYLGFAADNTHLWRALFDLDMTVKQTVPDWYLQALGGLFESIAGPLAEIFPGMARSELDLMTRALFSAVHGIILLGLENRISGVPRDTIEHMVTQVLNLVHEKR